VLANKINRWFILKVRATSPYAASSTTEAAPDKLIIEFKIPKRVRRNLEAWRKRCGRHLSSYGIHWKMLGVILYPPSIRSRIQDLVEAYEQEYYKYVAEIEGEEVRNRFNFKAVFGEFIPIQPQSSEIISSLLRDSLEELRKYVEGLRVSVTSHKAFIELTKEIEMKLLSIRSLKYDSLFAWTKEANMLFANICALLPYAQLEDKSVRCLKVELGKLRNFAEPLDSTMASVLDLLISLLSKTQSEGNLSAESVLKSVENFSI